MRDVKFTLRGNDYHNYGAPTVEVEVLIKDAIHYFEAKRCCSICSRRSPTSFAKTGRSRAVRETLDATSLARWRSDPIAFIEHVLCDPETGRPFVLSDAEREFLQARLHARRQRQAHVSRACVRRDQEVGKTTLAAIIMLTMILLYGGRFAEGYCVANDLEQAQ